MFKQKGYIHHSVKEQTIPSLLCSLKFSIVTFYSGLPRRSVIADVSLMNCGELGSSRACQRVLNTATNLPGLKCYFNPQGSSSWLKHVFYISINLGPVFNYKKHFQNFKGYHIGKKKMLTGTYGSPL